eukprot:CAMPEP_0195525842 /NCGR_PEP_ID=MMETSP0794_2-20130614/26498_1 /TAXON_ID=515487 /ORGANISM="Stephanopyxis turris, Strain CCMP 815" /LENGTH=480 /DNA_ID=CAMNT_0040656389 /DNA_START=51 /DNA_END=1493 /DNA_ORIENTATION=+
MSHTNDEISVTLVNSINGQTETISVSSQQTTLNELADFGIALFSLESSGNNELQLIKDGNVVYSRKSDQSSNGDDGKKALADSVIQTGDLILVTIKKASRGQPTGGRQQQAAAGTINGLDFSSLLGAATNAAPASNNNNGAALSFSIPGLEAAAATSSASQTPIEWSGMSLEDAISKNPNPELFIKILHDDTKHPNIMKELNYHSPNLASKIKSANGNTKAAAKIWREEMIKGSIGRAIAVTKDTSEEQEMKHRLHLNPMDEEANAYFGKKIQKENVERQYKEMMDQYPESMGKVLMLYINTSVNGTPIHAFVDSGAQNTIMSSDCADKCGLLHLLDTRFEGVAVGVGTGKILGRIHVAPLKIKGHFFPCSITVMDLGDKNMDFLFGLDMLKRHRCKIDLAKHSLLFTMENGVDMEAPFLHEKDLVVANGGTKGFDADAANAELQKAIEDSANDKKGDDDGEQSSSMDVDQEHGKDKTGS